MMLKIENMKTQMKEKEALRDVAPLDAASVVRQADGKAPFAPIIINGKAVKITTFQGLEKKVIIDYLIKCMHQKRYDHLWRIVRFLHSKGSLSKDPDLLTIAAQTAIKVGNLERALKYASANLPNGKYTQNYLLRSVILSLMGRNREAIKCCKKSLSFNPKTPLNLRITNNLALFYAKTEDGAMQAIDIFTEGIMSDPTCELPLLLVNRGKVYLSINNFIAAEADANSVLMNHPNNQAAKELLIKIYSRFLMAPIAA
jgi:tetratricopeptide (TPR) repeat protein